jgi:hypothetical protein
MAKNPGNCPAEIFGYPIINKSEDAQQTRQQRLCPFVNKICNKRSGLIDYPFGVCSVEHHGEIFSICPRRFEEQNSIAGVSRVLEDIAMHYFGDFNNVIPFSEVRLPNTGSIDYVLVRHKPMKAEIEDFVPVEFQTDSTTGTGQVVQGIRDFFAGLDVRERTYLFGLNTYDTIKRSMTQLLNKGIVYETWNIKGYWVIQEYIYANLVKRYASLKEEEGYLSDQAVRFALYNLVPNGELFTLTPSRFVSTTVNEVYQAMRNNSGRADKDKFIQILTKKLQARLSLKFD